MKKIASALIAAAVIATATACGPASASEFDLDQGHIVEKYHAPANSESKVKCEKASAKKCRRDKRKDRYYFKIQDGSRVDWEDVDRNEYNRFKVGDWYAD